MGIMCPAITDWAGPATFITRLDFAMRDSFCCGDTVTITGKVTGKRVQDNKHLVYVELLVANHIGPTVTAKVTAQLPSRG